jgi:hypothetical protein
MMIRKYKELDISMLDGSHPTRRSIRKKLLLLFCMFLVALIGLHCIASYRLEHHLLLASMHIAQNMNCSADTSSFQKLQGQEVDSTSTMVSPSSTIPKLFRRTWELYCKEG